jgi:hypothetical protein
MLLRHCTHRLADPWSPLLSQAGPNAGKPETKPASHTIIPFPKDKDTIFTAFWTRLRGSRNGPCPELTVLVACDSVCAGRHGMAVYARLVAVAGPEFFFNLKLCQLDSAADLKTGAEPLPDVVIVAHGGTAHWVPQFSEWLEDWAGRQQGDHAALIAVHVAEPDPSGAVDLNIGLLQRVAQRNRLTFVSLVAAEAEPE